MSVWPPLLTGYLKPIDDLLAISSHRLWHIGIVLNWFNGGPTLTRFTNIKFDSRGTTYLFGRELHDTHSSQDPFQHQLKWLDLCSNCRSGGILDFFLHSVHCPQNLWICPVLCWNSNKYGNGVPTAKISMGTLLPVVPIGNEPCPRQTGHLNGSKMVRVKWECLHTSIGYIVHICIHCIY